MWMKRGGEIRWFPRHEREKRMGSGWLPYNLNDREPAARGYNWGDRPDHLAPRSSYDNISSDGSKTVVPHDEWGAYAVGAGGMPLSGYSVAQSWFRDHVADPNRWRLASYEIIGYDDGAPIFEATWKSTVPVSEEDRRGGSTMFNDLFGGPFVGTNVDFTSTKRVRFKLPKGDTEATTRSAQDQLNTFLAEQERNFADYFKLVSQGGLSTGEANKMDARIHELSRIGNIPQDLLMAGWGTALVDPNIMAQEVAKVLGNERLGDISRRKKLADMVLGEIESSMMGIQFAQDPPDATEGGNPAVDDVVSAAQDWFAEMVSRLAGLGGGGGGSAPIYQPPDRREVEENVRNYLGMVMPANFDDTLVKKLTERYMSDHRRLFDNPESGVRPWFSVKEEVHKLKEYQQIHALRPDSIPEEEWATRYMVAIESAGIPEGMRDRTAANFATMGATVPAAQQGAFRMREHQTGRPQPVFLQNMRNAARVLAQKF